MSTALRARWLAAAAALMAGGALQAAPAAPGPATGLPAAVQRCLTLSAHGRSEEAARCHQGLTTQSAAAIRAEGWWGLARYEEANQAFRQAVAQSPGNALYRIRWGLLLHERFNDQDAQDLFKEALKLAPGNAQAFLGLAQVAATGFDGGAEDWARKALAADPSLTEAHELLALLALEDSDARSAREEADAALAQTPDALQALAVHASIELLNDRPADTWFAKIKAINPAYGQGHAIAARLLILAGRYTEGVELYRRALALQPDLWSARSELGINLMRLGQDAEAAGQLKKCYEASYRDAATVNTLRLLDSYKSFVTVRDGDAILKLHKKESDLLAPYFMAELKRDIADYSRKYHMQLDGPVQVEVYPDHEDFAVRSLGMPGLGALGVTFGSVVAMDSPSGRRPGEFHWASTLRHEMSHVFVLAATHHRVARWFTEGLAVHEETQASPEWGDPVTPEILKAMKAGRLLPVAELDRGFVHPSYAGQVIVSYFQAGQICDYIAGRWGEAKLLDMVHAFAHVTTTAEVLRQTLDVTPADFDTQFLAFVNARYKGPVEAFEDWHALLTRLGDLAAQKQLDQVIHEGEAVIRMYPQYVYQDNAYEAVAQAYLAKDDRAGAVRTLSAYVTQGGRQPVALSALAHLEEQAGDPGAAAATFERINYIDPVFDPDTHRQLGRLWLAQHRYPGAIREYSAVIATHPHDMAAAQLDLALALLAAGERDKAQDAVLESLTAAPGYKPAQALLLKITESRQP